MATWLMDFANPKHRKVFFDVHRDLPREGPGSKGSTERALGATQLSANPKILDIACGPGMQTIHLAELLPEAYIDAFDLLPHNVAEAKRRVEEANVGERVSITQGDMTHLTYNAATYDLIWCEGAAYIIGIETALNDWHRFLVERGYLAFSEPVWLTAERPAEVNDWWVAAYPEIRLAEAWEPVFDSTGYDLAGQFILPSSDWLDDYYLPMEQRLSGLRQNYEGDIEANSVLDDCQQEIDLYRQYSNYYGYGFFTLKKR